MEPNQIQANSCTSQCRILFICLHYILFIYLFFFVCLSQARVLLQDFFRCYVSFFIIASALNHCDATFSVRTLGQLIVTVCFILRYFLYWISVSKRQKSATSRERSTFHSAVIWKVLRKSSAKDWMFVCRVISTSFRNRLCRCHC